ncbi:MAG: bifunctional demethylmenaquinone methyltransferase/2-methoxy-6-polyprenyl-1,4-benzoquinol methylase UbiE [Dehalococcoidia bacterium]|nr:bifunctional demethylmenaquinone methyltransferase/2-methoxy-6-polyprenyl-1,4-benzoquinol methylase UbiE [Dehalococcoidia bacterium]
MSSTQNNQKARRVATMFARISPRYDFMNTVMTAGMHGRWRRLVARMATQDAPPGPALDVATGTGDLAFALARRPEVTAVVGLDFVSEMLELARRKQKGRTLDKVKWVEGDALSLPFGDGTFSCATVAFGLRNVADLKKAISEMARVVRPGGRVAVLDMTRMSGQRPGQRLLRYYFNHFVPLMGRVLAGDKEAYAYFPESVEGFPSAADLAALMEAAGMINVRWRLLGMGMVALHTGKVRSYPVVAPTR